MKASWTMRLLFLAACVLTAAAVDSCSGGSRAPDAGDVSEVEDGMSDGCPSAKPADGTSCTLPEEQYCGYGWKQGCGEVYYYEFDCSCVGGQWNCLQRATGC